MIWWQWALIVGGGGLVLYAAFVTGLLLAGRRADARALAGVVPDSVVLVRRLLVDERVPRIDRLLLAALVAYLMMPLDLVPDVIPVAGQLDDVLLVVLVLRRLARTAGSGLLRELWPGPEASLRVLMRAAGGDVGAADRRARGG